MTSDNFVYVDTAIGGPQKRNRVLRIDEFCPAPGESDCYTTVLRFTQDFKDYAASNPSPSTGKPPSVAGYPGVAWAPFFPADFDYENDPARAAADATACLMRWEQDYGLPPDAVRIAFSGSKGIHLEIPAEMFDGVEP